MSHEVVPDVVTKKITRRVMWLLVCLGLISIIDRTNVSYAALRMNADLGFSASAYGFGAGILFLGYVLFEVPSNMILRKVGARLWLARIAITWGILAAATSLVVNETMFYIIRFLLGVAEAGLFPGVVLYLTYWFPSRSRGRATALFMTGVPLATIIAAPISGWLVGFDEILGISGWQFMFIFWGVPAVLLGILIVWLLPNYPADVKWLTDNEKDWLHGELAAEASANIEDGQHRFRVAFTDPNTYVFAAMYFCFAVGSYGLTFFLPLIIQGLGYSPAQVGIIGTLPFVCGIVAMVLTSRHADKTNERVWHFASPMFIAGLCLIASGLVISYSPLAALILLVVTGGGLYSALGNFWARPSAMITGAAAAAGIAMINSLGNIGGFVAPYVMGILQDISGGSDVPGLFFMGGFVVIGGLLSVVGVRERGFRKARTRR